MDIMCNIEFDNTKVYTGEVLNGKITYNVKTPDSIYGIRVKICGKAWWGKSEIFLTRRTPNRLLVSKVNNLHGTQRHLRYPRNRRHLGGSLNLYNRRNVVFLYEEKNFMETDFYVYGNGKDPIFLHSGEHIFRFGYTIPSHLPSSFKCKEHISCAVEYTLSVERIIESMPYEDGKEEFFIFKSIDLNKYSEALLPGQINLKKDHFFPYYCCNLKSFNLNANISQKGVVAGKEIEITIKCNNKSWISAKFIRICLCLNLIVYSECEQENNHNEEKHIIFKRKIIMAKKYLEGIKSKETKELSHKFSIPSIQPWDEDNCNLFEIKYSLDFKVYFGYFYVPLRGVIPIIIGNIPIIENDTEIKENLSFSREQFFTLNDIDDANEIQFGNIQYQINNNRLPTVNIS